MDELQKAREKINEADRELAEIFKKRMTAAAEIAEYKKEHGLPVFDEAREKEVIEKNSLCFDDPELKSYYLSFLTDLMTVSKRYQHRLMDGMKVAYSGVEGAFADIAAKRIFPDGEHIGYGDFEEAYNAVRDGICDCAVLPVENSYAGTVGRVMDLLFKGDLVVSGIYTLPVTQNLLGLPDASVSDIKSVISHPSALSQCSAYLKRHKFETVISDNTALAAKEVAERGEKTLAAVASAETADLYGLKILDHDINESADNYTRFAVLSKTLPEGSERGRFILMFTVNDVAGALADAINAISRHGFNMKALKSRPVKERAWQYYFYVEAEGDETSPEGKKMIADLSKKCETLKIVGHFGAEIVLKGGEGK